MLFALYRNFKFPLITLLGVVLSDPIGGVLALAITGHPVSVSSAIGFLALFGVSVQTAVVYISYANELRLSGIGITAGRTRGGAVCGCAHHDDGARGGAGPAARRAGDRRRDRLAASRSRW